MHQTFRRVLCRGISCAALAAAASPAFCSALADGPVPAQVWPSVQGVVQLQVGNISVAVIEDRKTVFNKALFEGIEKDARQLALLPGGKAPGVVKSFLVRSESRLALIDSGYGAAFGGQTAERLSQMGLEAGDITDIVLTHLDGDHIGGLVHEGKPVFPKARIHLSEPEYEGWIVDGTARAQKSIDRAREILSLYKDRIETFKFGSEVLPGVRAEDAHGHTIGHARFDIDSQGAAMTIAGDLLHAYPLQAYFPQRSSKYDQDPDQAARMREQTLDWLSRNGRFVSGMHVSPMGWVVKRSDGGYALMTWSPNGN